MTIHAHQKVRSALASAIKMSTFGGMHAHLTAAGRALEHAPRSAVRTFERRADMVLNAVKGHDPAFVERCEEGGRDSFVRSRGFHPGLLRVPLQAKRMADEAILAVENGADPAEVVAEVVKEIIASL